MVSTTYTHRNNKTGRILSNESGVVACANSYTFETCLLQKAVMDAGVLTSRRMETVRSSLRRMIRLSVKVGCNSTNPRLLLRCLREVPATAIKDASTYVMDTPLLSFRPTMLPDELLTAVPRNIPVFLGHSGNEGLTLVSNGFGINDPLPEFRNASEAIEWCKELLTSGMRSRQRTILNEWPVIEKILNRTYFEGYEHESLLERTALFVGDSYFHCPMLDFYRSIYSQSTFYIFERAFRKNAHWDVNPEVYRSFHMTAHMHFAGSQLNTLRSRIHPEDLDFTLRSMEWIASFAKYSSIHDIPETVYPEVVVINSTVRHLRKHKALDRCRKLGEFFRILDT